MAFDKPSWREWLRPWEAAIIASQDARTIELAAERKRIRDRCYQRARRAAMLEVK